MKPLYIWTYPARMLLVLGLVAGFACNSPASPAGNDPAPAPALSGSPTPPTPIHAGPTPPYPTELPTAVPGASKPESDDTAALMASALKALPYFHLLGDDVDMPEFGRVSVNLDYVAEKMGESGNIAFAPILVDFLRVQLYYEGRTTFSSYLDRLVGDELSPNPGERDDWKRWAEWLGGHPEIEPPQDYAGWKGSFLAHIDPDMGAFFYDGVTTRIRLEEAVWGGVPKDGIPDLVNPPSISGQDAEYLNPTDRVFGVSINGEHRAYPLRILNPHEMANDTLGGVPIVLAY